jgi:hypothetical protein
MSADSSSSCTHKTNGVFGLRDGVIHNLVIPDFFFWFEESNETVSAEVTVTRNLSTLIVKPDVQSISWLVKNK